MNSVDLQWRLQRLSKMSASEVRWRVSEHVRRGRWASRQVIPEVPTQSSWRTLCVPQEAPWNWTRDPKFRSFPIRRWSGKRYRARSERKVIAAADEILAGRWQFLGTSRMDMKDPDWFFDPITGKRAPQVDYCFKVNHRSEDVTGNVKQIWELSRMQHLTGLAAAFSLTDDERYAEQAGAHLRSWWTQNPFLSGIHWTSGIEAGIRLISWVWVRRLLDGWAGAADLFERNEVARAQIWWHLHYLLFLSQSGIVRQQPRHRRSRWPTGRDTRV